MKTLFFLFIFMISSIQARATANCFAHTEIGYNATSAPMNDTGATVLIAVSASYTGYTSVKDVVGGPNVWYLVSNSAYDSNAAFYISVSIAINPITNVGATFTHTLGASTSLTGSQVWACNGVNTLDPIVAITPNISQGGAVGSSTCRAPSDIAPYGAGDLEFTVASRSGGGQPSNPNWTATNDGLGFSTPVLIGGKQVGNQGSVALAWKVATDTSSFRPTWTMSTSDQWGCINFVLKSAQYPPISNGNPFVKTIAGNGYQGYTGDGGSPRAATINWPSEMLWYKHGVPVDKVLVFVDNQNNVLRAINYDTSPQIVAGVTIAPNTIQTIAGTGARTCTGWNGPALSATMSHPVALSEDSKGDIAVADQQCATIDQIDPSGNFSYIAGGCAETGACTGVVEGNCGGSNHPYHGYVYNANATAAALIACPQGVVFDSNDNIIGGDGGNNRIFFVNTGSSPINAYGVTGIPPGNLVAIGGSGTNFCSASATPQPALSAAFEQPLSVKVDSNSNIYFGSVCKEVLKIDASGKIVVLAGTGTFGYSPDGTPALSANIGNVFYTTYENGHVYFTDTSNNLIRYIDAAGNLQTAMGNYAKWGGKNSYAGGGWFGDSWSSSQVELNYPIGYIFDANGFLIVSSLMSNVIVQQYNVSNVTLTVTKTGTGTGTVTSSDGMINCGSTCSYNYVPGTLLTLSQRPDPNVQFTGWSGDCAQYKTANCITGVPVATNAIAQHDLIKAVVRLIGKIKVTGKVMAR